MDTKKKKSKFKEMMGPPYIKEKMGPPKSLMRKKKRKAKKKINKNLIPSEPRNMPGFVPQG
jgi:hypothetical protein